MLGGASGVAGYGLRRAISGNMLQSVTDDVNQSLSKDVSSASTLLTKPQYTAGQSNPGVTAMNYGNAVENGVADQIEDSFAKDLFEHVGGPNNPDFPGKGIFAGLKYDITTGNSSSILAHQGRAYGSGLIMATYQRPPGFSVFP